MKLQLTMQEYFLGQVGAHFLYYVLWAHGWSSSSFGEMTGHVPNYTMGSRRTLGHIVNPIEAVPSSPRRKRMTAFPKRRKENIDADDNHGAQP